MSIINAGKVYHVDASKYLRGHEDIRTATLHTRMCASAGTHVYEQERMQQGAKEEDTVSTPVNPDECDSSVATEECNGWRNYETWQVYCRISDNETILRVLKAQENTLTVALLVQEYVETSIEAMTLPGLAHDLAMAASNRVDYRAIALFLLDKTRLEKEQMI